MRNKPNVLELGRTYLYVGNFHMKFNNLRKDNMVLTLTKMERPEMIDNKPSEPCHDCTFEFRSGGHGMAKIFDKNVSQEEQFIMLENTPSTEVMLIPLDIYGKHMALKMVRAVAYKAFRSVRDESVRERISNNEKAFIEIIKERNEVIL